VFEETFNQMSMFACAETQLIARKSADINMVRMDINTPLLVCKFPIKISLAHCQWPSNWSVPAHIRRNQWLAPGPTTSKVLLRGPGC